MYKDYTTYQFGEVQDPDNYNVYLGGQSLQGDSNNPNYSVDPAAWIIKNIEDEKKLKCDYIMVDDLVDHIPESMYKKGFGSVPLLGESDPNGKQSKEPGAKLDAGKSPLLRGCLQYFPRALAAVAQVSEVGANKYTWNGWEKVPDGINRYGNALARHLAAEAVDGPIDRETECLHAAQVAWNSLARLELILKEKDVK